VAIIQWIRSYPGTDDGTQVNVAFSKAADVIGAAKLGFQPDELGTHSIYLRATMAMYLNEVPVYT